MWLPLYTIIYYWKLGIHWDCLSSMCIPVGTLDHYPLPGRKKVFHLELNVMIIIWQTIGMNMHVYIWYIYLFNSHLAWDSVRGSFVSNSCALNVCVSTLSNDHEKLNPLPGDEARVVLKLKHISRSSKCLFTKLVPISRYCNFIPDVHPPNSYTQFFW